MNVSAVFIARPVATILLTLALVLAGIISFQLLPVSPLPQVDFPTIAVTASLPGADPQTMSTSVAAPLERQFGRIAGVTEMTSTSTRGSTAITLQFELNRDIDGAARDVQGAINAARGFLPANLPNNPRYRKVNPSDAPILILALTSDTIAKPAIYDAASSILQQKLSQVEGVGQVFLGGSSLPAVRVELNPLQLNRYGISLDQVRQAISQTSVNRPKGTLVSGERSWEVSGNDQLRTAQEYLPLVVAYRNGAALTLSDVARVHDSVEDVRTMGIVNGKPAVMVIMFRQPGANIIETVDKVRALLPQLKAALPGAIDLSVVLDRTPPIRGSLHHVGLTLVISGMLVILVVFWFLRDLRATAIPALAVAVSIIGTFAVMYLFGYSLDNLSLMALTIATGFVVDDAIVVLENVTRYREMGQSPMEAALSGSREIAFTVFSMSVSLVAVFIPILLMEGMVGRLFREFAVTLSAAILVSLVVSLTLTPMMCARLPKPEAPREHGFFFRASERSFAWLHARYEKTLRWALGHSRTMLVVMLATVVVNVILFYLVPKGFFPEQDTGRISGNIQAAQDISFQAMSGKLERIAAVIKSDPEVEYVTAFTGGGGLTNTARMFVALKPFAEREASASQIIKRLRGKIGSVPGAPTFLAPVQDLRIGGRVGSALYQYTLQGDNLSELNHASQRLLGKLRAVPQLVDLSSDLQDKGREATLVIDRPTASRLGVTPRVIDDILYDAFGQRQVAISYTLLNQYHVVMEVDPVFRQSPETLRDIHVPAAGGALVPLSAFTRFEPSASPLAVNHQGQFPSVTLSFNLAPGVALGDAVKAIGAATREIGLPAGVRGSFSGTAQAFQASLENQPFLILAALVSVYIVLGILYESYMHPWTILSTLPSAGVGAALALLVFRTELSLIALIGVILLIGIVKKNGILMVDFALSAQREEGKSPEDAIFEACLLRFRPIMMTTMAALFGAVPLALGTGVGSELRRPLGISIMGGLIFSQMLTLYTTPVVYLYMDRLRAWIDRKRGRSERRRTYEAGRAVLFLIALAALAACTAGPDYVRPTAPVPAAFKESEGWKVAQPRDAGIGPAWWELFDDPQLSALEEQVVVSNQNVLAAEAQLRQARALTQEARAGYYPSVTAGASVTRSRRSGSLGTGDAAGNDSISGGGGGSTGVTVYSLPVEISWEADLWGGIRRGVEANRGSAQASEADLAAAKLSAQAELAQDYFLLRSQDAQKQLLEETAANYQRSLDLTRNRYSSGVAAKADLLQAEAQLKTTTAQALDLGVRRAQLEHAIALLIGRPASSFSIAVAPMVKVFPEIPAGLPSQLLERRPDVAAAERRMAAANARIGVAGAAYFPRVQLGASVGLEALRLADWFSWPSRFWAVGPALSETLFDGGLRRARTEQARAAYEATVAAYRQTVLAAFQEVEDSLAALRVLEAEALAQEDAVKASLESLEVGLNQYRAGIVSYLNVIVLQSAALANQRTAVDILSRRLTASVLLIRALGGGWDGFNDM